MNIYNWFKIFNINEFLSLDLVSKSYALRLQGIGDSIFTAYQGNYVSVQYLDEFMPVDLYEPAQYEKGTYSIYRDDATGDVYFGFLVVE